MTLDYGLNDDILNDGMGKLYQRYHHMKLKDEDKTKDIALARTDFDKKIAEGKNWRTQKGRKVCSLGELLIAEYLDERDIFYYYDAPFVLEKGKKIRPDFTLDSCSHLIMIEYFGKLNDEEYNAIKARKIETYSEQEMYHLISILPHAIALEGVQEGLFAEFLDKQIESKKQSNSVFGFFKYLWTWGCISKA